MAVRVVAGDPRKTVNIRVRRMHVYWKTSRLAG